MHLPLNKRSSFTLHISAFFFLFDFSIFVRFELSVFLATKATSQTYTFSIFILDPFCELILIIIISAMRDHSSSSKLSKLINLFQIDSTAKQAHSEEENSSNNGIFTPSPIMSPDYLSDMNPTSSSSPSPYNLSPWNPTMPSPFINSPWIQLGGFLDEIPGTTGLVGSLVREEGHVYSLATSDQLLFTGSESKNIRVWKNRQEFGGFKSSSGFVKAMVISNGKIFTGHQDGKIRVWKVSPKDPTEFKRVGSLPMLKDFLKKSVNPSNYVEVRRHRNVVWVRHFDSVSSLSLDEEAGLLYSGSWDKTVKVWRVSDFKCLESINAHDDAVNTVAVGCDGLIFTGSADGTVKVWRREMTGSRTCPTRHVHVKTLLQGESAVTAIAISKESCIVYSGSSDGKLNFWDVNQRFSHCGSLQGHKMPVLCLAVSNRIIVSGSADKTLCVWKREETSRGSISHQKITVLTGHEGPVKCVAIEEEEKTKSHQWSLNQNQSQQRWMVYSGSLDRSVKVWRVGEDMGDKLGMNSKTPLHVRIGGKSTSHMTRERF
ncbi:hypothetical protein LUZ60_005017 [Juncus effusus]|nr:hypothetical protein LUZ60_005017 [Juncus effusus]